MTYQPIKSFTDLKAWQEGHELVLQVYAATKTFPTNEWFGLVSQLQRSAVSVTSNLAEGFGREDTKDRTRFYVTARGSIAEAQNQLLIARDIGLITSKKFTNLFEQSISVYKLIN